MVELMSQVLESWRVGIGRDVTSVVFQQCTVNVIEYIVEKETKCLIIVVVDVDLKDCEKGEKPKDENEEAKTKATMIPPGTRRSSKYGSGTSMLTRCCTSEHGTCNHLSS